MNELSKRQSGQSQSKTIYLVLAIIIIVILFLVFSAQRDRQVGPGQDTTDFPASELPTGFPESVPIVGEVNVKNNFRVELENGFQATRSFQSELSIEENFEFYSLYLDGEDEWEIKHTEVNEGIGSILASGSNGNLSITVAENSLDQKITVEINFVSRQ